MHAVFNAREAAKRENTEYIHTNGDVLSMHIACTVRGFYLPKEKKERTKQNSKERNG
jgi:hypothetical protein